MKKIIGYGLFFIVFGFVLGELIFNSKNNFTLTSKNIYYVLQEGVYSNKESIQNNLLDLKHKIIDYQDNKYYVYLGITKDKEVLERLQKLYAKRNIKTISKEKKFISEEFLINVNQFDLLIKETKDEDQVLTIEDVVLANFEEIFRKK